MHVCSWLMEIAGTEKCRYHQEGRGEPEDVVHTMRRLRRAVVPMCIRCSAPDWCFIGGPGGFHSRYQCTSQQFKVGTVAGNRKHRGAPQIGHQGAGDAWRRSAAAVLMGENRETNSEEKVRSRKGCLARFSLGKCMTTTHRQGRTQNAATHQSGIIIEAEPVHEPAV